MMAEDGIVILGAGGHASVIIELIRYQSARSIIGLIDIDPRASPVLGVQVIGDDTALPRLVAQGVKHAFVAIGDNHRRMTAAQHVLSLGFTLVNAISSRACISPSARVGVGVAVMAGAVVNAAATIEDLVIVNTGSVVEHDVRLGVCSHVGPGAILTGGVKVGARAFLGAASSVTPGVEIGADAIVGAGACVIRNVAAQTIAVGVPARAIHSTLRG